MNVSWSAAWGSALVVLIAGGSCGCDASSTAISDAAPPDGGADASLADSEPATVDGSGGCVASAAEVCNGLDDDCDGLVDAIERLPGPYSYVEYMWDFVGSSPVISTPGVAAEAPDLVWLGDRWLVVWEETDGQRQNARYATVTPDGVVARSNGFLADAYVRRPRVVSFRDKVGLTMQLQAANLAPDEARTVACVLDPAAIPEVLVGPEGLDPSCVIVNPTTPTMLADPSGTAASDTRFAIVFAEARAPGETTVRVTLLDATGAVVSSTAAFDGAREPSAAYDAASGNFLVAFTRTPEIHVARVSQDGVVLGPPTVHGSVFCSTTCVAVEARAPALSFGPRGGMLVYVEAGGAIRFEHLDAAGEELGENIRVDGGEQAVHDTGIDIAWLGGYFGVLYVTKAEEDLASFVKFGGYVPGRNEVDARPLADTGVTERGSAIAPGGTGFGVAWMDASSGHDQVSFRQYGCP